MQGCLWLLPLLLCRPPCRFLPPSSPLPVVTPSLQISTSIDNNGLTVLSVGPLVVVAVSLGSALLSYKTFVIAPAIEAQIGVVAFALGLHQTILGEIEETVAEGYHACGATRTLPSPYLAAC